ncbi:PIN domain-containing protein [Komagataeibacter xylinus]
MSLYLDTSVLVVALTNEEETTRMQDWLGAQAPEDLSISDWVVILD